MTHSELPYRGSLVDFKTISDLLVINSSFLHLQNEQIYTSQQNITSDSATFKNDVFQNISLVTIYCGAAISFRGTILTVEHCLFQNMVAGWTTGVGGAIFTNGTQAHITDSIFRKCTGQSGGAIFSNNSCNLTVVGSQFEDCQALVAACNYSFSGSSADSDQLNGGGGAIFVTLDSDHQIIDCSFVSCSAKSFGGGILIWNHKMALPTSFRLAFCEFVGTEVTDTDESHNSGGHILMVAIGHINDVGFDDQTSIPEFFAASNSEFGTKRLESLSTDAPVGVTPFAIRIGRFEQEAHPTVFVKMTNLEVSTTGEDSPNCGTSTNPCRTVMYASSRIQTGFSVNVLQGTFKDSDDQPEDMIEVLLRTITIEGAGNTASQTETRVEFSKSRPSAVVHVTGGKVTLSAITFKLAFDSSLTGYDLVDVAFPGAAILTHCSFVGTGDKQNGRLVTVAGGSLDVSDCEFANMSSTKRNGAAIHVSLTDISKIGISSSSFTNCAVSGTANSAGAGIFLSFGATKTDFLLRDLSFSGNDAERGKDVFVSAEDLEMGEEGLTPHRFLSDWENNDEDNTRFRCESKGGTFGVAELGIPEFLTLHRIVYLNLAVSDSTDCGTRTAPCKSITFLATQVGGSLAGLTVFVTSGAVLNGSVNIKGSVIQPLSQSEQTRIEVTTSSPLKCTARNFLSQIDFVFMSEAVCYTATVSVSSGTTTLTRCSFKPLVAGTVANVTTLFVTTSPGILELCGVNIENLVFYRYLFDLQTPLHSHADSTFSGCLTTDLNYYHYDDYSGLFLMIENGSFDIVSSSFTDFDTFDHYRGIIDATVTGGSLSLHDCTFKNIFMFHGHHGVVYVSMTKGSFVINSTSFSNCSLHQGIYGTVTCLGSGGSMMINSSSFVKCNNDHYRTGALFVSGLDSFSATGTTTFEDCWGDLGGNLYLEHTDLVAYLATDTLDVLKPPLRSDIFTSSDKRLWFGYDTGVSAGSLLFYWYPHTSNEESTHIHTSGENHVHCGIFQLPCQTIPAGLARKNKNNLFLVDSKLTINMDIRIDETAHIKSDPDRQTLTTTSKGKITVALGSLSLHQFDFVGTVRESSFVEVNSDASLSISSCSFSSFSAPTAGAAISAVLSSPQTLSIVSTSFSSCASEGNGGALFIDVANPSPGSFNLAGASFGSGETANGCGVGQFGEDVFISGGDMSSFDDKTLFPSVYSSSPIDASLIDSIRLSSTHTSRILSVLQYLHHPSVEGWVDHSIDSEDIKQCGHLGLNCQSLDQLEANTETLSLVKIMTSLQVGNEFQVPRTMTLTSNQSPAKAGLSLIACPAFSIQSQLTMFSLSHLTVSAQSSTSNQLSGSFFSVEQGTLVFESSVFSASLSLSCSLISVSATGSLSIDALNLESTKLTSHSMIEAEGAGSINIQSSSFASITRDDSGDGTVLSSHLALFSSFVLHHITITNCGTAILLNMEGCVHSTPYSVTEVKFTTNAANQLVVIGSDLSTLISKDKWTGSFESLAHSSNVLFSSDTRLSLSVTLLVYLIEQEGDVVLSGSGPSWDVCGSSASPCSTLERGLFRAQSGHDCRCTDSVPLGQRDVVIEKAMKVEGVGVSSSRLVFNTAQILFCRSPVNSASSSITFASLTFQIPAQPTESAGFVVAERGFVAITECAVSCGGIATSALVCTNPASTLIVDKGTFANIVSSASGPAFSSTLRTDMTVHVTSTVFDGCQSAADGGALAVRVETGELLIANCVFRRCGSSGDGGGIWLNLEDLRETSQFSLTDTTFGVGSLSNSAEGSGDCVFVVGKRLKRVIVPLRWKGSFEQSAPTDLMGWDETKGTISLLSLLLVDRIVVSSNGSDSGDGTDSSPFQTMWRCMEETKGKSGPFQVVVVGKSGMGGSSWMRDWASWEMDVSGMEEGCVLECWVDEETRSDERGTERAEGMMTLGSQTLTINEMVLLLKKTRRTISAVFVLLDSSRLVLELCTLKTETEVRYSLICGYDESHAELLGLKGEGVTFAGKGGIVKISGSSSVVLTDCVFSSTSFWEGGVVWGSTCGGVWIRSSKFVKCSGKAFGSLVRVRVVGCGVSVSACNFTSCVTSVWFMSVCGEGGVVGGGCVVVEIEPRRRSQKSMAASLVDLSSSLFSDCMIQNTDTTQSMRCSDWTCVGGGGFMIVGGEKDLKVDLRLVGIVGCCCMNMGSDWNGWSGGVVVGKGSAVHLDRRGMIAEQNGFGVVVLRQLM